MSILKYKLKSIRDECINVSIRTWFSKRAYQSLLGKLLYIQKCTKPSGLFVNRILVLYRDNSHLKRIYLTPYFYKDIQ